MVWAKIRLQARNVLRRKSLRALAERSDLFDVCGDYFEGNEELIHEQWSRCIWPFLEGSDLDTVVEVAAGHGRNTAKLLEHARRMILVDIDPGNIAFCRQRFAGRGNIDFVVNDGFTLGDIPSRVATLVYCFDSMVHFEPEIVENYLAETARVLVKGGRGFFHHSNYMDNRNGSFRDNPGWRNTMSQRWFARLAARSRLRVVRSQVIDWHVADLDCLTLVEKG